jgi:hypothetical protein
MGSRGIATAIVLAALSTVVLTSAVATNTSASTVAVSTAASSAASGAAASAGSTLPGSSGSGSTTGTAPTSTRTSGPATQTIAPKPTTRATTPKAPVTATVANSDAMPVGNLAGWKQDGTQDFSTPAALGKVGSIYGTYVNGYNGFKDTTGHGMYDPNSVLSVSNGTLDMYLHTVNGTPRVAAPVPFGYTGQTYGRYAVRLKISPATGYKIAFLLWPSSDVWNQGEIT